VVAATVSSIAYIAFDMLLGLSLPSGILGWGF
jgi:putative tricarboxylic transport membrane protein